MVEDLMGRCREALEQLVKIDIVTVKKNAFQKMGI